MGKGHVAFQIEPGAVEEARWKRFGKYLISPQCRLGAFIYLNWILTYPQLWVHAQLITPPLQF